MYVDRRARFQFPDRRGAAFTIVELLVVMAVIAILFSAIFVASSLVLERARTTSTAAVLQVVSDALEAFRREQEGNPTITRASRVTDTGTYRYLDRYGAYPPDELEVFTEVGLPGWDLPPANNRSLAPGRALIAPSTLSPKSRPWGAMRFYTGTDPQRDALEHRDVAAMVLAIELFGDESKAILDKIPDRNWKNAPLDAGGTIPAIWLDRPLRPGALPDDDFGKEDVQVRYLVDDWGVPLSYFAQRDWSSGEEKKVSDARISTNHPMWREASSTFIRLNNGLPVIMSYGPDGPDQLTKDAMTTLPSGESGSADAVASLVGDYATYPDSSADRKINHPLNDDNVYVNPELRERLAQGP